MDSHIHILLSDESRLLEGGLRVEEVSAKALAEVRQMAEDYAVRAGYVLNPIQSIKEATLEGLARNLELYGRPFCPCQLLSHDMLKSPEEADKVVCPCAAHPGQIAEQGCCHCGLFMTKTVAEKYLKARTSGS